VRKKTFIGALAVAAVASLSANPFATVPVRNVVAAAPQPQAQLVHTATNPLITTLPVRQALGAPQGELFAAPPPPKPRRAAVAAPAEPPAAPPMPYRVAGQLIHDGKAGVVLAKGDRVFMVEQGDVVEGDYRVESIEATRVTLVYLPLNTTQHLATNLTIPGREATTIAKAPTPSLQSYGDLPPAQLRWEGPERVQAGSPFQLVLKLNSAQPVHASPVQLTYDPKVLEPVAVNAGELFTHGAFSYRLGPNGSIFIAAPGGGALIDEADFLVLTFKPTQAGTGVEVTLSSAELKGFAGQSITYEPPAAFRTTVLR
jgi:hypothetical protein